MTLSSDLARWLNEANLPANGRLPPERELAELFSVNRAELRKALGTLETDGRITRHVGRGTFLTSPIGVSASTVRDIARHVNPVEAMQARLVIEPGVASLAAVHATISQIDDMRRLTVEMRAAASWSEYEEHDWTFHNLLAQACNNRLLLETEQLLNSVRRIVVWRHLKRECSGPPPAYHSFEEHDAIIAAIARRDRRAAAQGMERHLKMTLSLLQAEDV